MIKAVNDDDAVDNSYRDVTMKIFTTLKLPRF